MAVVGEDVDNLYYEAVEELSERQFGALKTHFSDINYALLDLYEDEETDNWVESGDVRDYMTELDMLFNKRKVGEALSALAEIDAIPQSAGDSYGAWSYCEETDADAVRKAIRYRANGREEDAGELPTGDFPSATEELRMMDEELAEEG